MLVLLRLFLFLLGLRRDLVGHVEGGIRAALALRVLAHYVVDDVAHEAANGVNICLLRLEDPPENVNRNEPALWPEDVWQLLVLPFVLFDSLSALFELIWKDLLED